MKKKLVSILVSFVVALGLWLYVITVVSPGSKATFYNIPVYLEGASILEERGMMVTAVNTTNVDLELSGNRVDLNELNNANIIIKANLATIYDPGEDIQLSYSISYPGNVASNAFTEESRSPGYVTISVERIAYKSVPVNVITTGSVPSGYVDKAEEMLLDYDEIQITGPASVVSQISQARIEVSLNDQTESVSQSFRYTLCNALGDPVDSELITVNTKEVNVKIPVQQVKVIKLKVNLNDGGGTTAENVTYDVSPGTIQVCGSKAALAELGNELILGSINLAEYSDGAKLNMDITLPSGVTNMSALTEATVTLHFPDLAVKVFTIERENIELLNVPEGMEAELLAQVLIVTVRGPKEQISLLDVNDVVAAIDFTGAEPGTSYRRVTVTLGDGFPDCGAMKIDSVSTTVREIG